MKKIVLVLLAVVLALPLVADPGNCPKNGDFGFNIKYPGMILDSTDAMNSMFGIGVTFHLSDNIFMRGSCLFNYRDNSDSGASFFYIGGGVDFFLIIKKISGVSFYFGPGISYLTSNTGDNSGTGSEYLKVQLKLGLQYNLTRHLAIHGEYGFGLSRERDNDPAGDERILQIGSFGATAGIVIYL